MYTYNARLVRVIDGDTYEFDVDTGFGIRFREKFRLYGADTPEVFGRNATPEGKVASEIVSNLLLWNGPNLVITTYKDKKGKYGRYLVDVIIVNDENGEPILSELNESDGVTMTLAQYLIMNGIAREM
jgi:micrococcal nuclease